MASNLWIVSSVIRPLSILLVTYSLYQILKKQGFSMIMVGGSVGGIIIISSAFMELGFLWMLIANVLMMGASILNLRQDFKKKAPENMV